MKSHNVCALAAALLVAAGPASAAVRVKLAHNTLMNLRAPAGTVLIGDPTVADVSLVTPRKIAILGRGFGSTNVIVTDRMGRVIFSDEIQVSRGSNDQVSVYRGVQVSNFTCSPSCQRTLAPGDDVAAAQPSAPDRERAPSATPAGGAAGDGGGGGASPPAMPR